MSRSGLSNRKQTWTTGESPTKVHENDKGTEVSVVYRKAEKAETVQPGEKVAQGESHQWVQIPEWRVQRGQRQALLNGAQ